MGSSPPFLFLCLLLSISCKCEAQLGPWPTKLANACYTESVDNLVFQKNLNILLSDFKSAGAASYIAGFNQSVAGNESDGEDRLYGLFLCRADLSSAECQACVVNASQEIPVACPDYKEATIWYDWCTLTYSYKQIFGTVRDTWAWWFDSANVSLPINLDRILNTTLGDLIPKAADAKVAGKKFAVNKTSFTESEQLYTLAQCTPDLTSDDCERCLQQADHWSLPRISEGAVALLTSCNIRYERYPFYDETAVALLSSAPAAAPTPPPPPGLSTGAIVAITVASSVTVVFFLILCLYMRRRARMKEEIRRDSSVAKDIKTAEQFDFAVIQAATNNFSAESKLGEGGFGVVYKGVFRDAQEVAVKRLFKSTSQGIAEFKNEVNVVAKLQHRNLVRLLGFCVEKGEKILVFEYMPNKSLDNFLVDSEQRGLLDWSRRYSIVSGIAQGMLYLHEYSRLRIIHRDLKTGNILLDADMHPKISDFGMARIVGIDQTRGTASKVAGTLGYMPPEYLRAGHFSVKSDVYSFGVLVLEIIAGKKNSSFYELENAEDLPSYAWKHWNDGTPMEVLDPILKDCCSRNEVIRCIHISLLCLQQNPDDRPTMTMIDEMLKNFGFHLPDPQPPPFFRSDGTDQPRCPEIIDKDGKREASVDKATITLLEAR